LELLDFDFGSGLTSDLDFDFDLGLDLESDLEGVVLVGVGTGVGVELLFFGLGSEGFEVGEDLSPLEEPPFFRRLSSTTVNPSGSTLGGSRPAIEGTALDLEVVLAEWLVTDLSEVPDDEADDVLEDDDRASL
jgi:hypothetical protein